MDQQAFIEEIGITPEQLVREMDEFRVTTSYFIREEKSLLRRFADRWIAVNGERVVADGSTLEEVLERVDAGGVPRDGTLVRFMDSNPPTLMLTWRS